MMISDNCSRYCLFTFRGESANKGDEHWEISKKIASLIWGNNCRWILTGNEHAFGECCIHDYLSSMTDSMDTVLGMPIGSFRSNDYFDSNAWGDKMFNWIWDHWDEMCKLTPKY